MFKQPNISLFTIVQFFIGTIFVLNTYISVTKRCVQILSSALSIVCVIDWFFFMLISQLVGAEGFDLI